MMIYPLALIFPIILPVVWCRDTSSQARELSYQNLWVYRPRSLVTDHVAIDDDLNEINLQLSLETSASYTLAEQLYKEGAHSKSIAVLTLDHPLDRDVFKSSIVHGFSDVVPGFGDPQQVFGSLHHDAKIGDITLWIEYDVNAGQGLNIGCSVGVKPSTEINGCFASVGNINLPQLNVSYGYSYNVTRNNINDRTIQGLSTHPHKWMGNCKKCPGGHFRKFRRFYGRSDYADEIVNAALYGRRTDLENGNMDLGKYKVKGRIEVVKKGMTFLNIWMWIIWQLEHATEMCEQECTQPESMACQSSEAIHAWDAAVAYYTGSRSPDDVNTGMTLIHATERRCQSFKTCGELGNQTFGAAHANQMIFKHFIIGQKKILRGDCAGANISKEIIINQMTVPLVQGAIQYAHKAENSDMYDEKYSAQASAFAFSLLPIVHECNEEDAQLIHRELQAKENYKVDFQAIKSALERNYPCMNIECKDVGGVFDQMSGSYKDGAEPCKDASLPFESITSMDKDATKTVGATMGGLGLGGLVVALMVIAVGGIIGGRTGKVAKGTSVAAQHQVREDNGSTMIFA